MGGELTSSGLIKIFVERFWFEFEVPTSSMTGESRPPKSLKNCIFKVASPLQQQLRINQSVLNFLLLFLPPHCLQSSALVVTTSVTHLLTCWTTALT